MKKIILSGYMGSGKSTIARLLHAKTGVAALDLDEIIEKNAGMSIPEIFSSKGEIYFRKLEHVSLREILADEQHEIISLGGGTPCYANNHELLLGDHMIWIYLKASPVTLASRIASEATSRPLLAGKSAEELQDFIAQHLFERSYYYNMAPNKIDTDRKTPDEIVLEIEKLLA